MAPNFAVSPAEAAKPSPDKDMAKKPQPAAAKPKKPAAERTPGFFSKHIKERAKKSAAILDAYFASLHAGFDPTMLYHAAVVGADYIARGADNITAFTKMFVEKFGEKVRPHVDEIYEESKKQFEEIKAKVDAELPSDEAISSLKRRFDDGHPLTDMQPTIRALALHFIHEGVTGREPLIDKVHEVLKTMNPDITRCETMDAICGYGDYKQLSTDTVDPEDTESAAPSSVPSQEPSTLKLGDHPLFTMPVHREVANGLSADDAAQLMAGKTNRVAVKNADGTYTVAEASDSAK